MSTSLVTVAASGAPGPPMAPEELAVCVLGSFAPAGRSGADPAGPVAMFVVPGEMDDGVVESGPPTPGCGRLPFWPEPPAVSGVVFWPLVLGVPEGGRSSWSERRAV